MKKVLVIAYYWPPNGGAGVQRWVKFVKYLNKFNWEPIIYTPKNNELSIEDKSLLKDIPGNLKIIQTNIWEPYAIYKKFIRAKKDEKRHTGGFISENKKSGLADKISIFIKRDISRVIPWSNPNNPIEVAINTTVDPIKKIP